MERDDRTATQAIQDSADCVYTIWLLHGSGRGNARAYDKEIKSKTGRHAVSYPARNVFSKNEQYA